MRAFFKFGMFPFKTALNFVVNIISNKPTVAHKGHIHVGAANLKKSLQI